MLKLLGALCLIVGAATPGFAAAARLRARVDCVRAFSEALELMERELSFRLTPMPVLLEKLASGAAPPVDHFFLLCARGLGELGTRSMAQIWRGSLETAGLPLGTEERQVLRGLGEVVGRYDGEGQREALALARVRLDQCLARAEEERSRLGRVYSTLGLAAGSLLVILLA